MAMPTNSATQSISFLQMQTEFGGSSPIGMGEYYRSGSYVPNTVSRRLTSWTQYSFDLNEESVAQSDGGAYGAIQVWHFNGGIVFVGAGASTQVSGTNGYGYKRGTYMSSLYTAEDTKNNVPAFTTYYYKIQQWQYNWESVSANQSVPTSGTMSMLQFYGGTDD